MNYSVKGDGDPDGKRLARRRSAYAEEGCRLAECLASSMRRAGVDDSEVKRLAKDLRLLSVAEAEKAHGRIESRLTTKNTGHPLLEGRQVNCLFLDESGSPQMSSSDPVFALGGISMSEEHIPDYVANADSLKRRFFGRTDISFHEPHMRNHRDWFDFNRDALRRAEFDEAVRELVTVTPFIAFGVAIRKREFQEQFVEGSCDPYLPTKVYDLAIMLMLERYVDYLATNHERRLGRVHLESIQSRPDAEHQAAYTDLLLHGTQFVPESTFQSWVEAGCRFSPKTGSYPGELADLVAREVFEWARSDCKTDPPYWEILKRKTFCRADGMYGKFGLKVFPANDLIDTLVDTKIACGATLQKN